MKPADYTIDARERKGTWLVKPHPFLLHVMQHTHIILMIVSLTTIYGDINWSVIILCLEFSFHDSSYFIAFSWVLLIQAYFLANKGGKIINSKNYTTPWNKIMF